MLSHSMILFRIFQDKIRIEYIQRIISLTFCISVHSVLKIEKSTTKFVKQSPVLHIFIS